MTGLHHFYQNGSERDRSSLIHIFNYGLRKKQHLFLSDFKEFLKFIKFFKNRLKNNIAGPILYPKILVIINYIPYFCEEAFQNASVYEHRTPIQNTITYYDETNQTLPSAGFRTGSYGMGAEFLP